MEWTRLTIHGSTKRADVVVPSDQPLCSLLPRLMDLLEEPSDAPRVLVTAEGRQLAEESSLEALDVPDGELVRLVPADQAPRPPEVSDLSRAVAMHRGARTDVWNLTWARRFAAPVLAVLAAALSRAMELSGLAAVVGVLVLAAAGLAIRTKGWFGAAAMALALGPAAMLGWNASQAFDAGAWTPLSGLFGAYSAAALTVALVAGVAGRSRPLLAGGLVGALAGAPLALLPGRGAAVGDVAAVLATVCVFVLGLVPSLAVTVSGLGAADERPGANATSSGPPVARTILDAYAAWTWLVVALSVPLAASLAILVRTSGPFSLWLALALAVVVATRTRLLPLAAQVASTGGVLAAALVSAWTRTDLQSWARAGMLLFVVLVVLGCARPAPEHLRARLRTWANTLELLAVVAVVPCLLGHLRVFGDLLAVFTR